jgi:hypothetical protein
MPNVVQTMIDTSPEAIEQWIPRYQQPPLHFAVQQDRIDIVELLLSHGANLHSRNGDGITALANCTTYQGRLEIPRLLRPTIRPYTFFRGHIPWLLRAGRLCPRQYAP